MHYHGVFKKLAKTLLGVSMMLAACQTTQTAVIDLRVVCAEFTVFRYSKFDTYDSQKWAYVYNAKRNAMCEGV